MELFYRLFARGLRIYEHLVMTGAPLNTKESMVSHPPSFSHSLFLPTLSSPLCESEKLINVVGSQAQGGMGCPRFPTT